MSEDFSVLWKGSVLDNGNILITSPEPKSAFNFKEYEDKILSASMEKYGSDAKTSSVIVSEDSSGTALTIDDVHKLAININSDLSKLKRANQHILQYVLTDPYAGRAYECIYANINTSIKLNYPGQEEYNDANIVRDVQKAIEDFNRMIDIDRFTREAIAGTVLEGNYNTYLRMAVSSQNPTTVTSVAIDHYPLSLCYQSDYYLNGENVLQFEIGELRNKLQKQYPKYRRTKKAVFFENLEEEVKANYSREIYEAYMGKEQYLRLDPAMTYTIKINSMGRKFGVSPFFKALKPLIVLGNIEKADVADSKTRSKKIIFQKLRKELLGSGGQYKGFAEMEYAHSAAAEALQTSFCLYTAPAFVEDLSYVIDNSTNDNTANTIKIYTSRLLTALGISFADSELSSFSAANISVDQLMRTINSISEQVEQLLRKYYQVYLRAVGLPPELAPTVKVLDSEMMDWGLRKEFAQFAYNTLNISRNTAFKLVGLDIQDEKTKREQENADGYDAIFTPRQNAYNSDVSSVSAQAGRPPSSHDLAKQAFDKSYSDKVR